MPNRRDLLKAGAWVAAGAVIPPVFAAGNKPGTLLILGGTGFIGPPLTKEAQRLGWKVTHFNRGKTATEGVADVETLIGDRKGQLDALRGRRWDAVIDDTGFIPKYVRKSAEMLASNVGYCLYISSISAYASFAKPNDEQSPTGKLSNPDVEEITDESYGPMKALCEQYTVDAFKGRASVVRRVTSSDRSIALIASRTGRCAHRRVARCSPRARQRTRSRSSTYAILPGG